MYIFVTVLFAVGPPDLQGVGELWVFPHLMAESRLTSLLRWLISIVAITVRLCHFTPATPSRDLGWEVSSEPSRRCGWRVERRRER
jgi:hypothetical protein